MGLCLASSFRVLLLAAWVGFCAGSVSLSRSALSDSPACFAAAHTRTTYFSPRCHDSLVDDSRSLAAKPPKNSDVERGDPFSNSYNDDAFGLIFLNSAVVLRDFNFSASFLMLSAITAACVSGGAIRFRSWLPGAVAFISLAGARLAATFGVNPFEWASEWVENSAMGPAFGLDNEGVLLVELAACTVSLLWGISQDPGDDK